MLKNRLLACFVGATLTLAACGGGAATTPTSPTTAPAAVVQAPAKPAKEAFETAFAKGKDIKSYSAKIEMSGSGPVMGTDVPGMSETGGTFMSIAGDFDGKNNNFTFSGAVVSMLSGDPSKGIQFATVDGKSYVRGPVPIMGAAEDKWYVLPEGAGAQSQPPIEATSMFNDLKLTDAEYAQIKVGSSEQIDGVSCTAYTGTGTTFEKMFGGLGSSFGKVNSAEGSFWICSDDYVRKVQIKIDGTAKDKPDQNVALNMLVELSNINGSVKVEAPTDAAELGMPVMPNMPTAKP
ncbi:MAG: hypothetical protein MUD01_14735 [Chloroflexaceae bacterium]|nr:hypothetical protein [Chloroflexaceae bacterium]